MGNSIAIITARSGSKRIPKKNIKDFCGKPIITYSIEAALKSNLFDEVMVSTDSEEIAEIAEKYGAAVPFYRSVETSGDYAVTSDVLKEVIAEYAKRGHEYEYGCCLYPTSPFVTGEKIAAAVKMLLNSDADTVMPVVEYSFPPQRGAYVKDGFLKLIHPEHLNTRSQDLEKVYHDAGQFYVFRIGSFVKNGKLMSERVIPYIISELEVQDIDTETDWRLAELKYMMLKEKQEMKEKALNRMRGGICLNKNRHPAYASDAGFCWVQSMADRRVRSWNCA